MPILPTCRFDLFGPKNSSRSEGGDLNDTKLISKQRAAAESERRSSFLDFQSAYKANSERHLSMLTAACLFCRATMSSFCARVVSRLTL